MDTLQALGIASDNPNFPQWLRAACSEAISLLQGVDAAVMAERERWIAACNTVADGLETAGRPGAQAVAQVRRLAIDGA